MDSGTITITSTPNSGWQCPACMKCYAPHVEECRTCGKDASEQRPDPGIGIPTFPDVTFNPLTGTIGPRPDRTFYPNTNPVFTSPTTVPGDTFMNPGFTVTCFSPPSIQDLNEGFDAGDDLLS